MISLDPNVCVCTTMFRITPQHLLWALENLAVGKSVNRISVDERTRQCEAGAEPHAGILLRINPPHPVPFQLLGPYDGRRI